MAKEVPFCWKHQFVIVKNNISLEKLIKDICKYGWDCI
jgi:hypothetical protein